MDFGTNNKASEREKDIFHQKNNRTKNFNKKNF